MGAGQSRYDTNNLREFYQRVNIGDVLEFPRGAYSHFGIYVGHYNGKRHCVVHFTAPSAEIEAGLFRDITKCVELAGNGIGQASTALQNPLELMALLAASSKTMEGMSKGSNTGRIKADEIEDMFEEYSYIIINNGKDGDWDPFDGNTVAERATRHYESNDDYNEYNVYTNNSEHFVNNARYGKHRSPQVEKVVKVVLGAAAVGAAGYALYKRNESEERPQRR